MEVPNTYGELQWYLLCLEVYRSLRSGQPAHAVERLEAQGFGDDKRLGG